MNFRRLWMPAGMLTGLVLLCGCPNPNIYSTPRTVPAGKVQMLVALEGIGVSHSETVPNAMGGTTTATASAYVPQGPTIGARIGLADQVDLGVRIAQLDSLGADLKLNFLKTPGFDMAVDPGAQAAYFGLGGVSFSIVYLNLPLVLGINFSKAVTLVLTPGFTMIVATVSATDLTKSSSDYATASAPYARFGVGLNIRAGKVVAIQPEVTAMRAFNDSQTLWFNFGLGFTFGTGPGAVPDYSDVN